MGLLLVLLCGGIVSCAGGPEPIDLTPIASDLSQSDPQVRELLSRLYEAVVAAPDDAERRGALAMGYEVNGFHRSARATYLQAIALQPDSARWQYLLALARGAVGELEQGLAAIEVVIEKEPDYLPARLYAGRWLLDLGRASEAEPMYRAALGIAPKDRAATFGLARALIRTDRGAEALALLEPLAEATERDPHLYQLLGLAYRTTGQLDKARDAMSRSRSSQAPVWDDPWAREKGRYFVGFGSGMERAEELLAAGRSREAIEVLERLRRIRPEDPALLNNLSIAYRRNGRLDAALAVLLQGIARRPEYFPFRMNLGLTYQRQGDFDRALEQADEAIAINPTLGAAHALRGSILVRQQDPEAALAAFETALRYDARNASHFFFAGTLAAQLKRWSLASERLETAVNLEPEMLRGHTMLARVRARLGDLSGAEASLERAAAIGPDSRAVASARRLVTELRTRERP